MAILKFNRLHTLATELLEAIDQRDQNRLFDLVPQLEELQNVGDVLGSADAFDDHINSRTLLGVAEHTVRGSNYEQCRSSIYKEALMFWPIHFDIVITNLTASYQNTVDQWYVSANSEGWLPNHV